MENPLKISVACLSSECGKLDGQVPWTAFADHNGSPNHKPRHKNGSTVFDCSRAALKSSDIMRRKPRLVLTDVLKTEPGKDYIKRLKNRSNVRRLSGLRKVDSRRKEEELFYSETRSSQMEEKNKSKDITPKGKKRTPTSKRLLNRLRKPQNTEEEDDEESQGTKEMKISKQSEGDKTFAEVVDCGLSLSWQSTGDTSACDEISADFNKDKLTGSEEDADHCLAMKRKRRNPGLQCNGKSSPKRQRGSMLHPTGEAEKDGGRVPLCGVQEESDIDLDMERCIVQFTVGEEDGFQPLVPFYPGGKPEGIIISSRINSSPRNNSATQTSLSDPIVLSSDDEENREDPECRHRLGQNKASLFDTSIHRNASEEEESQQEMTSDTEDVQGMQMLVEEFPHSAPSSPIPEFDFPSLSVHFVAMYCGCYKLRADGCLMIAKNKIVIPLKGTSEQGFLTFVRTDLRRYSVWDKQELEAHHIRFEGEKDPLPPGVLLLYVSETAAGPIQQVLNQLCDSEDGPVDNGKASRFILLTLKDPVEGMEGALLRSLLDIDCINGMTYDSRFKNNDGVQPNSLLDSDSPVLSMDDSIKLIRNIGADSYLLSILCIKSPDSDLIVEKEPSDCDEEDLPTAHIWVDTNVEKDTEMPLEKKIEDGAAEAERNMDKEDEEPKTPSDSKKEEVVPVYTVCHQRRKGSYSVSLCKPDSNWIKYKHEGLSKRLIQFPPPPLKGGITVTMEDLQCLDSWQYLNDVIIDFYLKYLIQKSSAVISKRSHIFSSFFYKQLTRRDNASEGGSTDSCQRQRRHQRVKTWTRHVDIFEKDFLFVPVNQEAHWYLAMICFPGLEEPLQEDWLGESQGPDEAKECKSSDPAETLERLDPSDGVNTETENHLDESTKDPPPPCRVSCTEQTCRRRTVCKRPCILIMDSLKLSSHERICKLLREYLQSEWEVRRGSSREFGPDQLKSSHCIVPLQDNSSDCGLYLLQYVECFLKDPVVHFDLPLQLQKWFPRQVVRKKRDEIRDLILNLYRLQNLDSKKT